MQSWVNGLNVHTYMNMHINLVEEWKYKVLLGANIQLIKASFEVITLYIKSSLQNKHLWRY